MADHDRPLLAARALIASLLLLIAFGTASAAAEKRIQFNIVAQDLASALNEFARQSAQELLFSTDIAAAKRTSGVVGEFAPADALRALLQGTGLRYRVNDDKTILIEKGDLERTGRAGMPASAFMTPMMAAQAVPAFRAAQEPEGDAQDSSADSRSDEDAARLGDMLVTTGSHIPGAETASPVLVFGRADFDEVGAATVPQFLATLTQNFGGGHSDNMSGDPRYPFNAAFGSAINLRGLGPAATLVLVNGRRTALSGRAQFTDISMIPLSAVERIEVVTDGASAIYGADAIGGVVNLIMRKDYTGFDTRLRYGTATQGEPEEYLAAQTLGAGWNSGNATISYEYHRRESLNTADRDFSAQAVGPFDGPRELVPGQESNSFFATAHQSIGSRARLTADLLHTTRNADFIDWDPFTPEFNFSSSDNKQYGTSLALELDVTNSWQLELAGTASGNKIVHTSAAPSLVEIIGEIRDKSETLFTSAEAKLTGELFRWSAGPINLALGGSYRDESLEFSSDAVNGPPQVFTPQTKMSFNNRAAFAELQVPIVAGSGAIDTNPRLTLSLAGRYEEYSNFGTTFDPKFGVRWQAFDALALRATYGTSFKAPSVTQVFSPRPGGSLSNVANPESPSGTTRSIIRQGNNADLNEETANTWTIGLDWRSEALGGLTTTLTYFDIEYEDRITTFSVANGTMLTDEIYAGNVLLRGEIPDAEFDALVLSLFGNRPVVGCANPTPQGCAEPPSNVLAIVDRRLTNVAGTRTTGLDLALSQRFESSMGLFEFDLGATYMFDNTQQVTRLAPSIEFLNTATNPVDLRARASFGWSRGGWGATLAANFTDGYSNRGVIDQNTGESLPLAGIAEWTTLDLNLRYDTGNQFNSGLLDDLRITLDVSNLLDEDPPFFDDGGFGAGYDAANADPVGRVVSLLVTKNW